MRGKAAWSEKSEPGHSEGGVPAFVPLDATPVWSASLSSVGKVSRQEQDLAWGVRAQTEGGHR